MEEKDLKQIKKLLDESLKENLEPAFDKSFDKKFPTAFDASFDKKFPMAFDQALAKGLGGFWEDNLEPAFDNVYNELQVIQGKLDRALYTELIHLEARVKRLEEKTGIKITPVT